VTEFSFEHDFRAPGPAAIFAGYFDAALIAEQDRATGIARREVLELDDGPDALRRVCRVEPVRQLPAILRPFVPAGLTYMERLVWHKAEDRIAMRIEPAVLSGRVEIEADYRVAAHAPGVVRRTYQGRVSVQVRLIAARLERAIVEDLGRSLQKAAACTQGWLDAASQ
jgi:hypothetical protein